MGKRITFVGWNRSVVQSVTDLLLPDIPSSPPDLSRKLIVVPTRQAGRRLRESLARRCSQGGTGLVGIRVVTPSALLDSTGGTPDASPMLIRSVWAAVLLKSAPDAFPNLVPVKFTERTYRWALQTGVLLQSLREQLAEAALPLTEVPKKAGEALEEPDRWKDLARIEFAYLNALADTGFSDPCKRKLELTRTATPPPDTDEIILAGVSDPPELVIRILDRITPHVAISILVHAPSEESNTFDDWGRPIPEKWAHRELAFPEPDKTLILGANPEDQARRVMDELDAASGLFSAGDIAIGVPDPEVAPFLANALAERGLVAFDPAEPPLSRHAACRLLSLFQALTAAPVYRAVADLLRHPDLLDAATGKADIAPASLLAELDAFQNLFMPETLDDFSDDRLAGTAPIPDFRGEAFPALRAGIAFIRSLRAEIAENTSLSAGVRNAFQNVYARRRLSDRNPQDRVFSDAASELNGALSELESIARHHPEMPRADRLDLLLETLSGQHLAQEREPADLDLEGWLELPWNPAPFLLVTGLNEGIVPESRMGDVFLPDSIRATLGLRHDGQRLARDLFLLTSLVESRRKHGRLRLLCGKTSIASDPLRPSRLLFRCPDEALPERAARLFAEVKSTATLPPASVSFKLNPRLPDRPPVWPSDRAVSVTSFRDYLECPFRFYLRHLLRMEPMDDLKTETDAREFGQLVHHALSLLYQVPAMRACAEENRIRQVLQDGARSWMHARYGESLTLPQRIVYEAAQNRLGAVAGRQAGEAEKGWEILAAETTLTLSLAGLSIKGKIDRIDFNTRTRAFRILDYKTSSAGRKCQDTHLASVRDNTPDFAILTREGKSNRWKDLQLPLYALLWKAGPLATHAGLQLGYFLIPPALEDTQVQVWEELDDATLDSARRCAEGVCDSLVRGVFWPPAERVQFDDDFRNSLGGDLSELFVPLTAPGGGS